MAHNSLILVERGGTNYRVEADHIDDLLKSGDKVLVQRDGTLYRATYDGSHTWANIRDGDTLIVWKVDDSKTEKATGAQFKSLFNSLPPLPTATLYANYSSTVPYGTTYRVTWNSTDGESYSASSWLSSNPGASGSKNFIQYPTSPTDYSYTYTVTNEAGSDSKTITVRVNGANYNSCTLLGFPYTARAHTSANLSIGSVPSILTRTTYAWKLTAPTATNNNPDHWVAFGEGPFATALTSTEPNPTIQFKTKSHKESGDTALNTGFGTVSGGFDLECKLYNPDNNSSRTITQHFIIKPPP